MKKRTVNAAQFKKQLDDLALGNATCDIELGGGDVVTLRIPVNLDREVSEGEAELMDAMGADPQSIDYNENLIRAAAKAAGQDPDQTVDLIRLHDFTTGDIASMLGSEVREAQERLGKFRYKG